MSHGGRPEQAAPGTLGVLGVRDRKSAAALPPLVLAYLGDAVYELLVREWLIRNRRVPVAKLHLAAARLVCAAGQAAALQRIADLLTDQEHDVVRRARNTKSSVPRNADVSAYRYATGFEALIGYLYAAGETARLLELAHVAMEGTS